MKIKLFIIALFIGAILSGCGAFQNDIQTGEQVKVTKCGSVKLDVKVPVAIPNIPLVDFIETKYNLADSCFYAHWCYTVSVDKSIMERAVILIEKVTAIVEKLINIFYQTKQ